MSQALWYLAITIMACPRSTPPALCPYLQVAEIIRNQIHSGELPSGSRITEAEITETCAVARSTARRTLAVLREENLIFTVPQRGSYVR